MFVLNVLLAILFVSRASTEDFLNSQYPLYGLTEVAGKGNGKVKNSCVTQLKSIFQAINKREKWGLDLLGASGAPSVDGFHLADNYWLGAYSQCLWIPKKDKKNMTSSALPSENLPFQVAFYVGSFEKKSSLPDEFEGMSDDLIHIGLCLPSSCTEKNLEPLLTIWAKKNPLAIQNLYNFTLKFQSVRLIKSNYSWVCSPITISLILVITTVAILMVSGTIYDIYIWTPIENRKAIDNLCENNNKDLKIFKARNIQEDSELLNRDNNLNESYELKIDNFQHKSMPVYVVKPVEDSKEREPRQNFFSRLSLCFSVKTNVENLFSTVGISKEIQIIHGIRFAGMNWLIWLYTMYYVRSYASNKHLLYAFPKVQSENIITNSIFSMDTFFFTSGFRFAYKYFRNRCGSLKTESNFSVKKKVNEFSFAALQRFLRLTPVYVVTMAVAIISLKITKPTSLLDVKDSADQICRKTWWRNLAYISNLFDDSEMCMTWSWYLSTEMQFFLLGLFILILSTRFWKFIAFVSVMLIVVSSFVSGFYGNEYSSRISSQSRPLDVVYSSPWMRVAPYLIGMFTGYLVVHFKGKFILKKPNLIVCWILGVGCGIWALFGLRENASPFLIVFHAASSRIAWSFCLSWIVVACCTNKASGLKAILSISGWTVISKLFYSAYLLGPLIISMLTTNAETSMHLSFFQTIVYFVGTATIIYFSAFFLFIALEIPVTTLGKQFVGKKQVQNQLSYPS